MIKVKDIDGKEVHGLVRLENGSLSSIDSDSLREYKKLKDSKLADKKRIESLENELIEIKELLKQLISK